jgi:hypothetical protein
VWHKIPSGEADMPYYYYNTTNGASVWDAPKLPAPKVAPAAAAVDPRSLGWQKVRCRPVVECSLVMCLAVMLHGEDEVFVSVQCMAIVCEVMLLL